MQEATTHSIKILDRPCVFFDLETTGADIARDRIVSIALSFLSPDGTRVDKYTLVNPGIPIPPEATAVHGITDEMVAGKPSFAQLSKSLNAQMTGVDFSGFNIRNFDIPLLAEEFARAGIEWTIGDGRVFDAMRIFTNNERRRLQDAVKFYCGREITDAHNAAGDVESTIDVVAAMIDRYGFQSPADLHLNGSGEWDGDNLVVNEIYDPAGKLYVDPDGEVRYNFGKAKDVRVKDDPGFGSWMLKQDFIPRVTKRMLENYMRTMGR